MKRTWPYSISDPMAYEIAYAKKDKEKYWINIIHKDYGSTLAHTYLAIDSRI